MKTETEENDGNTTAADFKPTHLKKKNLNETLNLHPVSYLQLYQCPWRLRWLHPTSQRRVREGKKQKLACAVEHS